MSKRAIEDILAKAPVIPVITLERAEDAVSLGRALAAGGLPIVEITLRTEAALAGAKALRTEVPEVVVGLGTLLEKGQLAAAAATGAAFLVSPGATPELLEAMKGSPVPAWLPAAATASEVMQLQAAGFRALKFFPAEACGGVAWLKAVHPVFPEMLFCPTGGIDQERAATYLALPNVPCVGGSWIAPPLLIRQGAWDEIERRARAAGTLPS
ncbi:MAG TPA: bifunctional 4-hydroxy-2-oxoglutarate aldolase/2-dehydro-3-deoxy-phosphogluconate aldolase [Kiloniellales bacterium]|nr:bifunctional 4-hydroxy-2-oxoglutarate aldolase/2-dehydro-3-deoxy-phosphogluconate aldolase [Kiloniellales bacterium]